MKVRRFILESLVLFSIISIATVSNTPSKAPLRMRLNTNLLRTIFHKDDQMFLDIF